MNIDLVLAENLPYLEWVSVAFNISFVVLIMFRRSIAWPLGIIGSTLSVFYFFHSSINLPNEAILYSFYVFMGIYGWIIWNTKTDSEIIKKTLPFHLKILGIGFMLWILFSCFSHFIGGSVPMADAFTTAFGLMATYLEAKRALRSWWYWIILNAFSIGLYVYKDSDIYAGQMAVFAVLSVLGYLAWKKEYKRGLIE